MRIPGAIGPSYTLSTIPLDCQESINFFPEMDEMGTGKDQSPGALVSRPGLTKVCNLPQGPVRGLWRESSSGRVFAVGGNGLYEISSTWNTTLLGTLGTSFGTVSMSDNGVQLMIVDGPFGYILTLGTNVFSAIGDSGFYGSKSVQFIDGYFVLVRPDTNQFYLSNLYDGLTYNALYFASAEASPDPTVTTLPFHDQLVVFGSQTAQFYYDSGDTFPFTQIQGSLVEHGCGSPYTVAKNGEQMFWLGEDSYGFGVVYKAIGYQAMRGSNYGTELAFQGYGDISDATAFMFQARGHSFYVLNFTGADSTWAMDVGTGQWFEWKSINSMTQLGRWRANTHCFGFNKHIVGDFEDTRIYVLDFANFTDDGKVMVRRRRFPHISANLKRLLHSKFQLDAKVGVGTDGTDQGQQPTVMLRYSDDGGLNWSNEKWGQLGRIGQTLTRTIWRRLGYSRNRVYEVTVTDPVDFAIIGVDLDATPGAS